MNVADIAAWAVTLPILLTDLVVSVEIWAGLPAGKEETSAPPPNRVPDTVILIPAHDEARIIRSTLERLTQALPGGARILVVADNCSDETAALARAAGVEAIERNDRERRGKGFALEFGRNHMLGDPPQAVIIIDADCSIGADDIARLAIHTVLSDAPVQACDLIRPRRGSPLVEISTFAFAVKNSIRQQGLQRIGAAPVLAGTGMAFPWRVFATAPLATASLTEDLQLGLDLLRAGERPRYLATVCVWSDPGDAATTMSQRSRWESGFLATARRYALPTALRGLARRSWPQLWAGLHLMTPPLALLCVLNLVQLVVTSGAVMLGTHPAPLATLLLVQALLLSGLVGAWLRLGTAFLSPAAAARLPLYLLWKLPLYARLLVRRGPKQWVRADRASAADARKD